MADQNIKVRVSSEVSAARHFYVKVKPGEGTSGSAYLYIGSTSSSGSQISSAEFSTDLLYETDSYGYTQYETLSVYWSQAVDSNGNAVDAIDLSSSQQYDYQWSNAGGSTVHSAKMHHRDNSNPYDSVAIVANAYYVDIVFGTADGNGGYTDPTSSGWGTWVQRNSSGVLLDTTGPTFSSASFTGSANTEIKLVFNESPRDSSGDKWTASTFPSGSDMSWSPSGSGVSNVGVDSVTYGTTSATDDTVTLGISYDGSVSSSETLNFSLSKSAVYDAEGNQASSSGTFSPPSAISWPTIGSSGRTYYNRTFKITNSSSSTAYFVMEVDSSEGSNGSNHVQLGSVAASGTTSFTVSQLLLNDHEYNYAGQKQLFAFSSDQEDENGNLSSSFNPYSGNIGYVSISTAYMDAATSGRIEYSFDGSSFSGPNIYDASGNFVDVSLGSVTTKTVANSGGTGTFTFSIGEKVYKSSASYGETVTFSSLSELGSSDFSISASKTEGSSHYGTSNISSLSITGVAYTTSDDSGAMAIYGTDSTGNNYGTGWFYPVYTSDPGSSHQHTFSQTGSTVFYMPNSGSNHAQAQRDSSYVVYEDTVVVSFSYSGTATTSDYISLNVSVSNLYDANLNSGYLQLTSSSGTPDTYMQSDSSGGSSDMSSTKTNLSRVSVNSSFIPVGSNKATITLGSSDDAWAKGYFKAQGIYIEDGSGDAQQMTASSAELNLLDALPRGTLLVGNSSGASARLSLGSANRLLLSDGSDLTYGQLTNAMVSDSAAIDLDKLDWTSASGSALSAFAQDDYMIIYDSSATAPVQITMSNLEDAIFGNITGGDISGAAEGVLTIDAGAVVTAKIADDAVTPAKMSIFDDTLAAGDKKILIGDGSDYSEFALSGDVTMSNAGVVAIGASKVLTAMINDDAVTPAKMSIFDDTLAAGDKKILIGDGSDYSEFALSGDVTMSNAGVVAIGNSKVLTAMINDNAVTADKLADTAVTAGQYGSAAVGDFTIPEFTVDAQGRLTDAGEKVIQNAGADGSTKGVAAFDADDFDASSGVISLGNSENGAVLAISGTANEIGVSRSNGTVTVSLPDDITIGQDLTVGRDLVVTRHLTVNGDQFKIDGTTVQMDDSLMEMGLVDKSAPTSATTKDLGLLLHRHDGNDASLQFMGWDESADEFCLLSGVSETEGVLTGMGSAAAFRAGDAKLGTISQGVWQGTAIAHDYIGLDAIDGTNIQDSVVDSEHLAADSVVTAKILDANVTAAKLAADSVITAKILDANVTAAKLASDSVLTAKILDANVTAAKLATDSVETAKIKDANVTAAKLATDSVETAKIKDANVTAAKLAADSVVTAKILDANVTAAKLASDSVLTAKILDANVTAAKLATDSVETAKIKDANVTAAKLATDSVETAKIADDAVTADKLADTSVSAGSYGGSLKRLTATVDAQGRLTAMGEATIQDGSGSAKGVLQVGSGIQVSSGEISIAPMQKFFMLPEASEGPTDANLPSDTIRTAAPSSGAIALTFPLGGSGITYVESSLQVFLNGILLRKDSGTGASDACDYSVGAIDGSGNFVITLRADGSSPVMEDDDDVVTVSLIKA